MPASGYARCVFDAQDLTAQHDALPTTFGVKANRIYVDHGLPPQPFDLTTVLTTTVTTVAVPATPPTRPFGADLAWLLRLPAPGSVEVASCRSWRAVPVNVVTGLSQLGVYTSVSAETPRERRCRSTTFRGRTDTPRTATSRTVNPSAYAYAGSNPAPATSGQTLFPKRDRRSRRYRPQIVRSGIESVRYRVKIVPLP